MTEPIQHMLGEAELLEKAGAIIKNIFNSGRSHY